MLLLCGFHKEKYKMTKFNLLVYSLAFLLCSGCSTRVMIWDKPIEQKKYSAATVAKAKKLELLGDKYFAKRSNKKSLQSALNYWEKSVKQMPNHKVYAKLARGYYFLADGFYGVAGNTVKRDENFTTGLGFAEKGLKLSSPKFVQAMSSGEKFSSAVVFTSKKSVPNLYWYATNLGKWAASKGFLTKLKYKNDIKTAMDHVMALQPDYFYAAPWRYLGAYEAATAGLAGGSLQKSSKNFSTAAKLAPHYLATKVLWAEYLCTKTQNKKLYKKLLNDVLKSNVKADMMIEPENKIEQIKAKKLLAKIDDNF